MTFIPENKRILSEVFLPNEDFWRFLLIINLTLFMYLKLSYKFINCHCTPRKKLKIIHKTDVENNSLAHAGTVTMTKFRIFLRTPTFRH